MTTPTPTAPAASARTDDPVLEVSDLTVTYETRRGELRAIDGASLVLHRGETLGLVGESGCGKSSLALAVLRLLPGNARIDAGRIALEGEDLLELPEARMRRHRWNDIAIVFQGAMNALSPVRTVEWQIAEALRTHGHELTRRAARSRIGELLVRVGLPADVMTRHPHELSGGMRQRAAIAMALACEPKVIIADEPTTALDVIVQSHLLDQLATIRSELGTSIVHISHDVAVVAEVSDRVAVMREGDIVEEGPTTQVLTRPTHPYTVSLLASVPSIHGPLRGSSVPDRPGSMADTDVDRGARAAGSLLQVERLHKRFGLQRGPLRRPAGLVHAVDGLDLTIARGESVGLVGESGCGKTTLGRLLTGLIRPTGGRLLLHGDPADATTAAGGTTTTGDTVAATIDVAHLRHADVRGFRRRVQMIFQDPYESLNPRRSVIDTVIEPLRVQGIGTPVERERTAIDMLEQVGLQPPSAFARRFPHELSGGQRQRVAIARALVVGPQLVIADEPTSMLDVTSRAAIMDLMLRLARDLGLSYLFITHDLAVARHMCDRIAVMYLGKIVEVAPTETLLTDPRHPYTRALLAAVPEPDPRMRRPLMQIHGSVATPVDPAPTCRFLDRCPRADEVCATSDHPPLERVGDDHAAACFHPG